MNIEQLKMILDTIGSTTGEVKTFAISWLALDFISALIGWSILWILIFLAYKIASPVVSSSLRLTQLRNLVDPGRSGYVSSYEYKEIKDAVERGLKR